MFENEMVPVYYDAEFTGLHRNTTPISIGLVTGNPEVYFYAEFNDYDESQVTDWLKDNIINRLLYNSLNDMAIKTALSSFGIDTLHNVKMKGSKNDVANALKTWLRAISVEHKCKLQFYTDCYAYDWVVLNDLLCEDGNALNIPDYITYIPMDLSTALQMSGIDPDISREEFIGADAVTRLENTEPFTGWGSSLKHNCLWDAAVCRQCFVNIDNLTRVQG